MRKPRQRAGRFAMLGPYAFTVALTWVYWGTNVAALVATLMFVSYIVGHAMGEGSIER